MKSRIARTILGVLCVIGSFGPGAIAVMLFGLMIQLGRRGGTASYTFTIANIGEWEVKENTMPLVAIVTALAAVALFLGGLFLIFFWPREDTRCTPRAD